MHQLEPGQELPATPPPGVAEVAPAPGDGQPIRFLLIRQKPGALPWMVRALNDYMGPAQIVEVIGMANALWRLGHERFDAVLLDLEKAEWAVLQRCREQIADVAAVPVLDLHHAKTPAVTAEHPAKPARERRRSRPASPADEHQVARLPWERRAKREARKAQREVASVA